jgi:hypothetical protein
VATSDEVPGRKFAAVFRMTDFLAHFRRRRSHAGRRRYVDPDCSSVELFTECADKTRSDDFLSAEGQGFTSFLGIRSRVDLRNVS